MFIKCDMSLSNILFYPAFMLCEIWDLAVSLIMLKEEYAIIDSLLR